MMAREFPQRGEIWTVLLPGLPKDLHQPRPGLVVSRNGQNRWEDSIIVVPLHSAGTADQVNILIRRGTGGIARDSVLSCAEVSCIEKEFLVSGPYGRPVPEALLDEVTLGVRRAIGDVI